MSPAGRPKLFSTKKLIRFEQAMIDEIDTWREKQKPALTLSDAIRRLVELGLKRGGK
jgi:hypothetical protein